MPHAYELAELIFHWLLRRHGLRQQDERSNATAVAVVIHAPAGAEIAIALILTFFGTAAAVDKIVKDRRRFEFCFHDMSSMVEWHKHPYLVVECRVFSHKKLMIGLAHLRLALQLPLRRPTFVVHSMSHVSFD